jgi:hypothetical protein
LFLFGYARVYEQQYIETHKHAPQNLRFFGVRYTLISKKKPSVLQAVRLFLFGYARVYAYIISQKMVKTIDKMKKCQKVTMKAV